MLRSRRHLQLDEDDTWQPSDLQDYICCTGNEILEGDKDVVISAAIRSHHIPSIHTSLMTGAVNKTKNGVICPTCFATNDNLCEPKISMECTGDETQCVFYNEESVFYFEPSAHVKGCGTENICMDKGALLKPIMTFNQISCTTDNSTTSLPTSLPVGNFLWCTFCHKGNAELCTSNLYQCQPDDEICLTERTRNKYDGRDSTHIIRRCGKSNECSREGTIRSSSKLIVMNTTCCDTNFCTPPTPILPPVSKNRNGLTCPACFVPNSDRCLGRDDLHCTGEENRCVQFVRTEVQDISSVTETLFGCSNDNICEAGSYRMNLTGNYWQDIRSNVICDSANRSNKLDLIVLGSVLINLCMIKLF
ncbi:uncharacterized protein O3C94_014561 [Discoglossus pictus]